MFRSLLLSALILFLLPVAAQSQQSYSVTGVAMEDTLNMRAYAPRSGSVSSVPVVGRIPADGVNIRGTGNAVDTGGSVWLEIEYEGVRGWVNSRFLAEAVPGGATPPPADGQIGKLSCGGTEPFWSMTIRRGRARFEDPNGFAGTRVTRYTVSRWIKARGSLSDHVIYMRRDKGGRPGVATARYTGRCSDGMSDRNYGYEFMFHDGVDMENAWSGCCSAEGR